MILTCPACDTKYVVKDGAIPPVGRQVRCAACKHSWHEAGDPPADGDTAPGNIEAAHSESTKRAAEVEQAQWRDRDGAHSNELANGSEEPTADQSGHHADLGGPPMPDVDQDAVVASEPTDQASHDDYISDLPEPSAATPAPGAGPLPKVDLRTTTLGSSSMGSFSLRTSVSSGFSPLLPGNAADDGDDGRDNGDDGGADAARLDIMRSGAKRTPISLSSDEPAAATRGEGQVDGVPHFNASLAHADEQAEPLMAAEGTAAVADAPIEDEWITPASHSLRGTMSTEFAEWEEVEPKRRSPLLIGLVVALAIAAAAAAFWFLAPTEWKARAGIAESGATKLQVMITNSERQPLERGHELVAISGRIINPTDEVQVVPPIRAELRNSVTRRLVYQWTIAPPARSIGPRSSASFNSAEVDIPQGGDKLTLALGA